VTVVHRAVLVLVALAAGLLLVPASAWAARASSFSLYSDPGDFIGQGKQRVFHPGNTSQLGVTVEGDAIIAFGVGGPHNEGYSVSIAAPPGETLEPRNYIDVQRLAFRRPGHAGLDVEGMNRGCNELGGRFELKDLAFDAAGRVSRLWLVFQQHCEHAYAAAHGEVRFNAPVPDAEAAVAPGDRPLGAARRLAHRASRAGDLPRVGRDHPGRGRGRAPRRLPDRRRRLHRARRAVRRHGRLRAAGRGSRTAVLRLTDAAGAVHAVPLEGFRHGGTTSAEFEVLAGDVASTPGTYRYSPANARFGGSAFTREASLGLQEPGRRTSGGTRTSTPGRRRSAPGPTSLRPPRVRRPGHADHRAAAGLQCGRRRVHHPSLRPHARRRHARVRRQLPAALLRRSPPCAARVLEVPVGRHLTAGGMAGARPAPRIDVPPEPVAPGDPGRPGPPAPPPRRRRPPQRARRPRLPPPCSRRRSRRPTSARCAAAARTRSSGPLAHCPAPPARIACAARGARTSWPAAAAPTSCSAGTGATA
jgi:hypothetical protein